MSDNTLLQVQNLKTSFRINNEYYAAVDDVTLTVNKNGILGIVGESGSGKSALAFSILKLHSKDKSKIEGRIKFKNNDLVPLSERKMQKLRGDELGFIFQDPMSALNPLMTIGDQITEALFLHKGLNKEARKKKAIELLDTVGINNPDVVFSQFPHELSGGMRQRVVIAIAISCDPALLIADEPTTALDVTIQAQILGLINELKERLKTGVVLITHDLGVVAEMADRIAVMYAGQIVEIAPVNELFKNPKHPYTRSLLQSNPTNNVAKSDLHVIQGVVPTLVNLPREGCRFASRIPWMQSAVHEENPILHEITPDHFVRCTCYKEFYFPVDDKEVNRNGAS